MPGAGALRLGPIARKLISPDKWSDGYPGPEAYVKELDILLKFADEKSACLQRFRPNIEARDKQRNKALSELRLAYLLENMGFPITAWDRPGAGNKIGEFLLDSPEKISIFTEIKSPGWESELSKEQIAAGRADQPKYIGLQGGAVGNWRPVHRCIAADNCYPKFTNNQPSLLIVCDDLMLPLHESLHHVEGAVYGTKAQFEEDGYFTTNRFENIGGLGVFYPVSTGARDGLEYRLIVYENHCALPATKLPPSLLQYRQPFVCYVKGTELRGTAR
jgi:hypothetical protein